MSNLADRVKQIVKDEHKKVFKLTMKMWIIFFALIGPIILFPFLMIMKDIINIPTPVFVLVSGIFLCSFVILIIHAKNNPYEPERKIHVILRINGRLASIGVDSIGIIEEVINEVDDERQAILEKEKNLFSRISKIIFFLLLPSMAFLGKFVIESKILEIKNLTDVLHVTVIILLLTLYCIIMSLAIGNMTEEANHFKKAELKRTKEYLLDVKYLYTNPNIKKKSIKMVQKWEKDKSNQATADAAP